MRICGNCKTTEQVASRQIGESRQSRDQREAAYPSFIDMCNPCWGALKAETWGTLKNRYRPYP